MEKSPDGLESSRGEVSLTLSGLQKASSVVTTGCDVSDLELLAHYELAEDATGRERSGFAVLIELSDRRVALESDVPFLPGNALDMNFFLPDSGSDMGRTKVSLRCVIVQCRDERQLHYGARIAKISDRSRRAIERLLTARGSRGSS